MTKIIDTLVAEIKEYCDTINRERREHRDAIRLLDAEILRLHAIINDYCDTATATLEAWREEDM